jgi:hypothetical protein
MTLTVALFWPTRFVTIGEASGERADACALAGVLDDPLLTRH